MLVEEHIDVKVDIKYKIALVNSFEELDGKKADSMNKKVELVILEDN